jgi:SAM-dependent methyltransferase
MMDKESFKIYLDKQTYDKNYQDIECLDLKGYSESHKTWETIKSLVDWTGKSVSDLGCFHGYFCFKIEQSGAKTVYGLEGHPTVGAQVLETANIIKEMNGSKVEFVHWNANSEDLVPECDIILCMNCLHHFANQDKVLSRFKCKQVIFEVNENQLGLIKKYFTITKTVQSHRKDRTILLGEPIKQDVVLPGSKVFVTGVYGSGKTMFAKIYAKEFGLKYIDFDVHFNYRIPGSDKKFIDMLTDNYIADAIPFNIENKRYDLFNQYCEQNTVKIICCVCFDREEWIRRLIDVRKCEASSIKNHFFNFNSFYKNTLPKYPSSNMVYYDTCINAYITREEMYAKMIKAVK